MSGTDRIRVLLIEDDAADAEVISASVTRGLDCDVTVAPRMSQALRDLESDPFDAVVLDLGLPDSEGLTGLSLVQFATTDVPVIVCSGDSDHELALKAVQAGAQDYILKSHLDPVLVGRSIAYAVERKQAETTMKHLAHHDHLTGLPNRALLLDRIAHAIEGSRRGGSLVAVMYLDLDGFKEINDTLGHGAGDTVLKRVASCLTAGVRTVDTVCRFGGDEFVVLLPDLQRSSEAGLIARRILEHLRSDPVLRESGLDASASIGIAVAPENGTTAEDLIRGADIAMYEAKRRGGGEHQFLDRSMSAVAVRRSGLDEAMRGAIRRGELQLRYQPLVATRTGEIRGLEALIRWERPDVGLLLPARFLPDAEATRMIVPIGHWVLREACRQARRWQEDGVPISRLSINLSAHQLATPGLCEQFERALTENGISADRLAVEVTENAVQVNERRVVQSLNELRDLGIHVALDDFGIGLASLTQLRTLPIDTVKIDRTFVADVTQDRGSAEIVKGVIAVAHGLGKHVAAEGVETAGQLEFLRRQGCDTVQGYFFSPAVPAKQVPRLMADLSASLRPSASCK